MSPEETAVATDESSVVDLIDAIEEMVVSGRRVPFSSNVVLNEDDTLELIDRARLGLPNELVRARHTLGERETILEHAHVDARAVVERAQADAHAIITEAETRARQMVEEHEILRTASERAEAILEEAEATAHQVRLDADLYAREVMEELDTRLTKSLVTVRKGLETLPKLGKTHKKK